MRVLLFLFIALEANAGTWFVAPNGRDTNAGSESRPFRSINHAVDVARAGDTVAVAEGVYREAVMVWDKNATASATIRILGTKAVIDGTGVKVKNGLVMIGRSSWIHFEGFEVRNSAADGVVAYDVRNVKVRGNEVHHNRGGGIQVSGKDIAVQENAIHDNVLENASGKARQWSQAVAAEDATRVLIEGNRVFENYGEGIDAIRVDRVTIHRNRVRDNFSVNIYLDNARRTTVDANLVRDTGQTRFRRDGDPAFGIAMANERYPRQNPLSDLTITNNIIVRARAGIYYADSEFRGGLHQTVIAHNTIYGSTWAAIVVGGAGGRSAGHDTTTISDNIIEAPSGVDFVARDTRGVAFRANCWWGGKRETRVRGAGDVYADPQLGGDYRPRASSPCRAAGAAAF
ncbi:MAG TPA: right-handed parallel beta-helix repeat-containing protein [Thermoanaerobaculia bacterium]|nr:right-handed parallel beta-helix repeat-containing protein [Thermoanaerobaculia bacterium]